MCMTIKLLSPDVGTKDPGFVRFMTRSHRTEMLYEKILKNKKVRVLSQENHRLFYRLDFLHIFGITLDPTTTYRAT